MSFGRSNVVSNVVDVSELSVAFPFAFPFPRVAVAIKEDDNAGDSATAYSCCSITTCKPRTRSSRAKQSSRAEQSRGDQSRAETHAMDLLQACWDQSLSQMRSGSGITAAQTNKQSLTALGEEPLSQQTHSLAHLPKYMRRTYLGCGKSPRRRWVSPFSLLVFKTGTAGGGAIDKMPTSLEVLTGKLPSLSTTGLRRRSARRWSTPTPAKKKKISTPLPSFF